MEVYDLTGPVAAPSSKKRARETWRTPPGSRPPKSGRGGGRRRGVPDRRLYTATLGMAEPEGSVLLFHASLACDERELRLRLVEYVGEVGASLSRVREGLDQTDIVVCAMVTRSMREMLSRIAKEPDSPLAAGLFVHFVQSLGIEE